MTHQEKTNPRRMDIEYAGVAPPPRILLVLVMVAALLFIAAGLAAVLFLRSGVGLTSLIVPALIVVGLLFVGSIGGSILFRKSLPRFFALWIIAGWLVLGVIGVMAAVVVYRNVLAPGQRETAKYYVPIMRFFDPPPDAPYLTLPTPIPETNDISPEDLLNSPLDLNMPSAEVTQPVIRVAQTATPTPTVTLSPTAASAEMTPTVSVTEAAGAPTFPPETVSNTLPASARLFSFRHVKQTWNNCGPANITMALSYFGWQDGQEVAASYLKPDREDKNVSPGEMVSFVNNRTGVRAITRIGGDIDLLKEFLANDFPVVIETGYLFEGSDWLGHYQTVVGYDDTAQVFYIYDSYLGTGENGSGIAESYTTMDSFWQHFNRTFIVLYRQEDEPRVAAILGERADLTLAAEHALEVAQREAAQNPQNAFAWYNMGTAFTRLGRYEEAASAYDQARRVGTLPWRIFWYQFGPFEAYFNVGRFDEVLSLATITIENSQGFVEEAYYWQGKALAELGRSTEAASAYRQALAHNPSFAAAQDALNSLNI